MQNMVIGILIPLLGTSLGAMLALFFKKNMRESIYKLMLGFAAGVMMAASIWSLILPAIELSGDNPYTCYLPATIGFVLGMGFLMLFDICMAKKRVNMLNFAVIIHNIPEGFSVGVAFAGALSGDQVLMTSAFLLSIGIGIQNIPEGSIISLNMLKEHSKFKAVMAGILSGIVEPIASVMAILLIYLIQPILPYTLAFAAGAMIYVVVDELIPSSNGFHGNIGVCIGFCIMMILDVMLG